MVPGVEQGTNAVAISHHNGNLQQHQANPQHGQRSAGQGYNQGSAGTGRGSSNVAKRHHAAQRNIQATFYSDGTNMTGTTAATGGGAVSQNRGASNQKANIVVMKGSGPPQPPQHVGRL